jgi:Domain of unknown function (DUF4159)
VKVSAVAVVAAAAALLIADSGAAQRQRGGRNGRFRMPTLAAPKPEDFDGRFNFCRIVFRQNPYGDGGGWGVDYPRADENLSIRLSELTKAPVSFDKEGNPQHFLLRLTDDQLFHCPFIMMTEVGAAYFDEPEAASLRTYLLKGGFLWADDFWGPYAWDAWAEQIGKALPPAEFPIVDVPQDHPLFHTLFEVEHTPQIPSINAWGGPGGRTSERGASSAEVHTRAIYDHSGRMMVFITHNTDFGDAFEREGDDPRYFYAFSVDGYAVGIDLLIYAMTH